MSLRTEEIRTHISWAFVLACGGVLIFGIATWRLGRIAVALEGIAEALAP